ncbi:MAG: citramalate synthase [Sandaracinaceae bacterium]|nr:citramalate synthase [Sandaracinaceae bacterium]
MTLLYDTTLRDGTQREGLSLSASEKLRIAGLLDALGVAYVEGGWPGSNPKDAELFARARDVEWRHAKLVAFGATRRRGLGPEDDPSLSALLACGTDVVTLFGKSSMLHVREVLRVSPDENLRMIRESVAYFVAHGREVIFDAEHFFDGYALDASYAMQCLVAAVNGGASTVVLCDTNGGSFPWDVERVTREVVELAGRPVGIHAHDDTGCAVANSLAAVRAGARHVQCTMHGWGERCGNANLCAIAPALELKLGVRALADGALARLTATAAEVARIAGLADDPHEPYVGKSAFAHKAGVHVSAIRRTPRAYEHVDPSAVGNSSRVVISELSGRANVISFAERLGWNAQDTLAREVLSEIEREEAEGYSFDRAEGSVALRLARRQAGYRPPFEVLRYRAQLGQGEGEQPYAEVTVQTKVGERVFHTVGAARGPVGAFDEALRKALEPVMPEVARICLTDFAVRIVDGDAGTDARVRVWIEHSVGGHAWGTVGVSDNVIEAAKGALVDGLEHGLGLLARARSEAS